MEEFYDQETLNKVQQTQAGILKDVLDLCERHVIDTFIIFGSALGVVRHQGFIPWDDDIDVGIFREDLPRFVKAAKEELGDKYEFLTCETNPNYACTVTHYQKKGTKFVSRDVKNCDYVPGINIDIFVYDHLADGYFTRKYQYFMTWFLGRLLYLSGKGIPFIPYKGVKKKAAEFICQMVRLGLRILHITPIKVYRRFQKESQRYNKKKTEYYCAFETPKPWLNAMSKADLYPMKKMPFRDFSVYIPRNTDELLTRIFGDYMQLPPKDKRVNHRPYLIDFGEE
ncbi:MAG: LicD family protein [Faecalicatena sp.]|uniref:LicD family protein n=1 Tax=Faecalicatena sp. TaxID=2005360 RepID=UPI002585D25F|nr:LicD family protein [Faecalicatena sp.]MCI6465877.1 LicD family protein [Faecalicatena sp.]MDY5618707.1 LicD family protein [Lachnospiraceae bacterium]